MANVKQILKAARDLLTDPQHWTKGTLARNVFNEPVSVQSPRARCWCLHGAILKVSAATSAEWSQTVAANRALYPFVPSKYGDGPDNVVLYFNDDKTTKHSDVLALLDVAIEHCDV